jgi:hypothetical protein
MHKYYAYTHITNTDTYPHSLTQARKQTHTCTVHLTLTKTHTNHRSNTKRGVYKMTKEVECNVIWRERDQINNPALDHLVG